MAALAALAAVAAALWIAYSKFRKKSFSVSALESTAKGAEFCANLCWIVVCGRFCFFCASHVGCKLCRGLLVASLLAMSLSAGYVLVC